MSTTIAGRNLKVEVALTFSAAAAFTAVTKANPGVATKTTHGLTQGLVGYWSVPAGMVELDGQAIMVDTPTTNDILLAGLDTTDYSTFTAGDLNMALTWGLLDEAGGYSMDGGAADQLEDNRLHLSRRQLVAGLNGADSMTVNVRPPEVESTALAFVTRAARRGTSVLIKFTKGTRIVRVIYGVPSTYSEQTDAGALASGSFNVTPKAYSLKPNV